MFEIKHIITGEVLDVELLEKDEKDKFYYCRLVFLDNNNNNITLKKVKLKLNNLDEFDKVKQFKNKKIQIDNVEMIIIWDKRKIYYKTDSIKNIKEI